MTNIVDFPEKVVAEVHPDVPLRGALGKLDSVVVIGRRADDGGLYVAVSNGDPRDIIWLIEQAKHAILTEACD